MGRCLKHSSSLFVLASLILLLTSCYPLDRGFEFLGEYEAAQSGYRIRMVAGGNIKGGHDISDTAFSFVSVCPVRSDTGKPFDLTLMSHPEGWIKVESQDLGLALSEWNWRTAQKLFESLLDRAGFVHVASEEIKDSVRVIEGSLAGPKGTILNGQIDSIKVLQAKPTYLRSIKSGRPDITWVRPASLKSCE